MSFKHYLLYVFCVSFIPLMNANQKGSKIVTFPLPECYQNADGFLCCNKELEELMDHTYNDLTKIVHKNGVKWKKSNFHQTSVAIQRKAQRHFKRPFEVVVGAGDYASKSNFVGNLICKIKRDLSYIFAYASASNDQV